MKLKAKNNTCWRSCGNNDQKKPKNKKHFQTVNLWSFKRINSIYRGKKRASLIAHMVKNLPAMQETWVQLLGQEDSLEKEMATHSSILAWSIPWAEEPGGLQSVGLQESDTTEWAHSAACIMRLKSGSPVKIRVEEAGEMPPEVFPSHTTMKLLPTLWQLGRKFLGRDTHIFFKVQTFSAWL